MVTPMSSDFLGTTDSLDPILHLRNLKQKNPKLTNCIILQSQVSNSHAGHKAIPLLMF